MLESKDIAMQHHPSASAFYGIINLYRVRDLSPEPEFDQLYSALLTFKRPEAVSLTAVDQLHLLMMCEFPAICAVVGIPLWSTPKEVFCRFLDEGCHIIASYTWQKRPNDLQPHNIVIESYNADGFTVLDCAGGYKEGSRIELEPNFTDEYLREHEERKRLEQHGARRILPFVGATSVSKPLGIHRTFLIIYPTQ
jgi:hypothetical protein